jgi:hypothetical protein
MSVEAITWALKLKVERSTAKFVLVAMANCANNDLTCWPSVQYLSEATCQDRKTVLENIKRLKEAGYIVDTGLRCGLSAQVIVYMLKNPENGTVPKTGLSNGPENGSVKESQKRDGSENGTVPKTDDDSAVFPVEQSRFSVETVPKTGHGTVRNQKEPSKNRQVARGSRLPSDWKLLGKHAKAALEIEPQWSEAEIRMIGDKFRDHWIAIPGQKGCKSDWDATWRNWCRNEQQRGNIAKPASHGAWFASEQSVAAKGAEFGLKAYPGESAFTFKARVQAVIDNGGVVPIVVSGQTVTPKPQAEPEPKAQVSPENRKAALDAARNMKSKRIDAAAP